MGAGRAVSISLDGVRDKNLMQLKKLNAALFPVRYNDKYYVDALASGEFTKLGKGYMGEMALRCLLLDGIDCATKWEPYDCSFIPISIPKDPEFIVEAMSTNSSQPSRSSATPSSTSNDRTQSRNTGSATGTTRSSSATPQTPTSLRWDRQTIQFSVNAWVLVVAVLSMVPLVPRSLSNRAYRLSFLGTACSSLYSLYALYGKPRAWNLQAVQVWFQSVIATKDFIYFIYCITFVTSNLYLKFALLPILCRVLELVAKFVRRNFSRSSLYRKYLEESCVWVESNTTTLSILSSQAEIGIGFLLVISLLSWQRNIIQTFMYWQLLKLMYQAPVTASYHQSVWAKIGRTVNPLINRYAPFLNQPISAAKRWWLR